MSKGPKKPRWNMQVQAMKLENERLRKEHEEFLALAEERDTLDSALKSSAVRIATLEDETQDLFTKLAEADQRYLLLQNFTATAETAKEAPCEHA